MESLRGLTVASGGAPTLSDGEFTWGPLRCRNAPDSLYAHLLLFVTKQTQHLLNVW